MSVPVHLAAAFIAAITIAVLGQLYDLLPVWLIWTGIATNAFFVITNVAAARRIYRKGL